MRRGVVGLIVASALMLVLGLVAPGPAVAAASCSGQSSKTSTIKGLTAGKHPVVLVHGWTGEPLTDTQRLLGAKLGGDWQMFQFEYHSSSNLWAAVPQIAACLATYVADLSQAHHKVGGDGMIYLVGHSMGGLAARFAADPKWGGNPVTDENNKERAISGLIGGVVTLDTPHGGSPWGNTAYGLIKEALAGFPNPWAAGQHGASRCLALHQGAKGMPPGCDVPPYLAKEIPVTQVAGVLTVDRTLFGFHLYNISMGGDTVVPLESGAGYVGSGIEGKSATVGSSIHMELVPCTITSDRAFGFAATLGAGLLHPRLGRALARLDSDNAAMDALSAGKPDPALLQFLALADAVGDCAHTKITHNNKAISVAATALKADAVAQQARTSDSGDTAVTNINPFTASGALREGWSVADYPNGTQPVDCSYDQGSPSAVSPGTHECGASADFADACWTSNRYPGQILCLFDPFTKIVHARPAINVPQSTPAADQPEPVGLELDDGTRWRRRVGGSWGGRSDNLVGAYSCSRGDACEYEKTGKTIVILTGGGPAVDTATKPWTVRVGELGGPEINFPPPKTIRVRRAFYVTNR